MSIIFIFEIHSDEEIDKKYLKDFIITNLELKSIKFDKNSKIVYSYIKELKHYQILFIKNKIPDFLKYESSYDEEIIVDDKHLIVYKNSNFFYIQEKSSNEESLLSVLEKRLALENPSLIDKKQKSIRKNFTPKYIKPINTHSFKIYGFYFIFLLASFYFIDSNTLEKENHIENIKNNTNKIKQETSFYSLTKEVLKLYENSKINNTRIEEISFKNSKIILKIEALNKKRIYDFFKTIEKKSIDNITYDKDKMRFIANANYKIYRR